MGTAVARWAAGAFNRLAVRALLLAGVLLGVEIDGRALAAPADLVRGIMGLRAEVPSDARTAGTLGRERRGSGVVIDANGLVLTIGYLILEASAVDLVTVDGRRVPAEVVGYDHETGFGLVRATASLGAVPVPLGSSAGIEIDQPLLVVSNAGRLDALQARLVDRREFAGYWEYLLDDAIFTTPPHREFAGAALIDAGGRLVGIGSLAVAEAIGAGIPSPGNMFVPIDALKPILGDLLAYGRRQGPGRPWLGIIAQERGGRVIVTGLADDGPAAKAGVREGDLIIGVGTDRVRGLADLYRKIWALGEPGVPVPLSLLHGSSIRNVAIPSIDRLRWLKLQQTY
jgi:S1-C subfamily serine protease